jgi:GT2 family glycosyltransferase
VTGTAARTVLVSIVTHNESCDVEKLLPSLFAQTFRDFAIVAVDNASEDGTRATFAAFEKVTPVPLAVVASRDNLGYTGGHNLAIARAVEAGIPWVLVLNSDVVLARDYLERLLAAAGRPEYARAGAFTGKILRADGADLVPTNVLDTVGIRMTPNGRHFDIGADSRDDGRYDEPAEVFGVSGCIALYRTAALLDVRIETGFFDNDFFLYREDVDLAWRLRGRGWTARCVPAAHAWHRRRNLPERRKEMSPAANLHSVKNRFLLRINNAGGEHLRATFLRTFARDLVVVAACFTVERTSLPALRWLSQNRDRLLAKRAAIAAARLVPDGALLPWFTSGPEGARRAGA